MPRKKNKANRNSKSNSKTQKYMNQQHQLEHVEEEHKKKRKQYTDQHCDSLPNIGNTCFLNTIMQILYSAEKFRDNLIAFAKKQIEVIKLVQNKKADPKLTLLTLVAALFHKMKSNRPLKEKSTVLQKIVDWLSLKDPEYIKYSQDDCIKFLFSILRYLQAQVPTIIDYFAAKYLEYQTNSPKQVSQIQECYMILTKNHPRKQKKMEENSQMEEKQGMNFVVQMISAPLYLIVINTNTSLTSKISLPFDKNAALKVDQQAKYTMIANCIYDGNGKRGHYFANRLIQGQDNNAQWFQFNDSRVAIIQEAQALLQHNHHSDQKLLFAVYKLQNPSPQRQNIVLQRVQQPIQQTNKIQHQILKDQKLQTGKNYKALIDVLFKRNQKANQNQKQNQYLFCKRAVYFKIQQTEGKKKRYQIQILNADKFFYYQKETISEKVGNLNDRTSNLKDYISFQKTIRLIQEKLKLKAIQRMQEFQSNRDFIREDNKANFRYFEMTQRYLEIGNNYEIVQIDPTQNQKIQMYQPFSQNKKQICTKKQQIKVQGVKEVLQDDQIIQEHQSNSDNNPEVKIQQQNNQKYVKQAESKQQIRSQQSYLAKQQLKQQRKQMKQDYKYVTYKQQTLKLGKKYRFCFESINNQDKNVSITQRYELVFQVYKQKKNNDFYSFQIINHQSIPYGKQLYCINSVWLKTKTLDQACKVLKKKIKEFYRQQYNIDKAGFRKKKQEAQKIIFKVDDDVIDLTKINDRSNII